LAHRPLKRVLVIDDDPDLLAVVALALTALGGYVVQTTDSPFDAVETARRFGPDLILLDVMMPGLDGFGVLKGMREVTATTGIPIVFMSAQTDRSQIAHYERLGCLSVIPKPFDAVALPETLEVLWELNAQRRAEAHQREFETLRRAYIGELAEKMGAMQAAAAALAREGWDRSVVESLRHLAHRIAGSSGLYRLSALSRSAGALEEIVNRLLHSPTWPPASSAADLARLVQAVDRTARSEADLVAATALAAPEGSDAPASSNRQRSR
jgi:two-component system, OmpR family, response regulator